MDHPGGLEDRAAHDAQRWRVTHTLVIVESPFAPRTPLPTDPCLHPTPCSAFIGQQGVMPCCRCGAKAEAVRKRIAESALHARYLAACLSDCLRRDEAPFASHGLYTLPGVLDDTKPEERQRGIAAGFAWRKVAAVSAFYLDLGWGTGMRLGEKDALAQGDTERADRRLLLPHRIEYRWLGGEWKAHWKLGEAGEPL